MRDCNIAIMKIGKRERILRFCEGHGDAGGYRSHVKALSLVCCIKANPYKSMA